MLAQELATQGDRLFRWRSYVPLALLPVGVVALTESGALAEHYGSDTELVWTTGSILVGLLGLVMRAITVGSTPSGTSGRNTRKQIAEQLNTTGMYSVVRNPLYFANFLMVLGLAAMTRTIWFPALVATSYLLYYERIIMAEERFLLSRFGAQYEEWSAKTPALWPRWRRWCASNQPLSFRKIVRREYGTDTAFVILMALVQCTGSVLGKGVDLGALPEKEPVWIVAAVTAFVLYLALRWTKKRTKLLRAS